MSRTGFNASEQIDGQVAFGKQVEIDVGPSFVVDATVTATDPEVTPSSLVTAQVIGVTPSDGRSTQEIYLEQVNVFATPMEGHIRFDLQPKMGKFQGRFVIGYQIGKGL